MNEVIATDSLPTPVAQVVRRVNAAGEAGGAETFLAASYAIEVAIKLIGVVLQAGLNAAAPEQSYRMAFDLVRADGLGSWEAWIRQAASQPLAGFLPPSFTDFVAWANKVRTKPDDDWFRQTKSSLDVIFGELGLESSIPPRKPTAKDLIAAFVQIRNKTKAHGAVSADFFYGINAAYISSIECFLANCPIFAWRWIHLLTRQTGLNRGLELRGLSVGHLRDAEVAPLTVSRPGVHVWPTNAVHPIACSELLHSDRDCTKFLVPNGAFRGENADFIDYATGSSSVSDMSAFIRPPAPLPTSETHGLDAFDVQSNIFGNLPALAKGYVRRPILESELERRLRDTNHPIITLHGRGGIGKTSLALRVAHLLASDDAPLFDHIIWFSARDIDLRATGPKDVHPAVVNLDAVSKAFGSLFGVEPTTESFAATLRSPTAVSPKGLLFIFDNFETMDSVRELHEFLDTHTHLPNKVLLTSRERAFKADFPIEVSGMAEDEAYELMTNVAHDLEVSHLMTSDVMQSVYSYSEGHPYVIRVIVGEIAKDKRYISPKTVLPRRMDILNAVFERSFNKLSETGRRVFLTVAGWKSLVSELALLVVLGDRDIDVESGIDECERLSLIERRFFLDDQPAYTAAQVARVFGKKKLEGDPDRLVIQEDLSVLQRFAVVPTAQPVQVPQDVVIRTFVNRCVADARNADAATIKKLDTILERLAELWPDAWLDLGMFRIATKAKAQDTEYALRRAVEEKPSNKEALLARAQYAMHIGDEATFVASRLRAVELDPGDRVLLRDVAFDVCKYINAHAAEIPIPRRGVYVASLREQLRKIADELDATALSRLAWLYLLEDNSPEGLRFAQLGLKKDPGNEHCQRIVSRILS